jgi:hypothetical protein
MVRRSLVMCSFALSVVACGGADDSAVSGGQDLSQGGSAAAPSAAASSKDPSVLVKRTDKTDPSKSATVTVDSKFHLTWQVGATKGESTLVGLIQSDDQKIWGLQGSSSYVVEIASVAKGDDTTLQVAASGESVECDAAKSGFDEKNLDPIVKAVTDSLAKQETFADCMFENADSGREATYTYRPALGGAPGVVIEAQVSVEGGMVLLATSAVDGKGDPDGQGSAGIADGATYTGDGGEADVGVSTEAHFKVISMSTSAMGDGLALDTITWTREGAAGQPNVTIQSHGCNLKGEAAVKAILQKK